MKFLAVLFVFGSLFFLTACPVRNVYDMEEYQTQSSYNTIFKGQAIPDDVRYNH